MRNEAVHYTHVESPVGPLLVAGSDDNLIAVSFPAGRGARQPAPGWCSDPAAFRETSRQLSEYFAGRRIRFSVPYTMRGSAFQEAVWTAMLAIPYGETRTYGEIAAQIGEPAAASRAVGTACGENPLPILVPCHRVVGAGGALTGFGGGLERKKFLLDLEFRTSPPAGTLFAFA